jgi:hypothetical protein
MIADKSTAHVLTELRSLVQSRLFLIALIEKEPGPDQPVAMPQYSAAITAAASAVLGGLYLLLRREPVPDKKASKKIVVSNLK